MKTAVFFLLLCFLAPLCFCEEISEEEAAAYQAAVDAESSSSSSFSSQSASSSSSSELSLSDVIEFTNIAVVGAGWAGSYAAWRLATGLNPSQKIRMYEKLNRIGGRAFFVDKTLVPELNGLEDNFGGYRFNEKEHILINAIVKTVFNIPTRCFSYNSYLNITPPNCPTDADPLWVYTRGQMLTPAAQQNSANWPYNFGSLSWTSLANRPSPAAVAVGIAFPFINTTTYPGLLSCNDTLRWATVETVTQRIKNCATDPECNVPGKNPNAIPIKYFVQNLYTEDFFQSIDHSGQNYLPRSSQQATIYASGVGRAISFGLTGCGGAAPMQVVQEGGGRKGYATAAHLMVAAAAAQQGVSQSTFLKFDHQLTSIRKWGAKYLLLFTNGKVVVADKVILNVGFWNLVKHLDKHDNILFDNASANLKAVFALSELSATKTYLHYNKAWWIKANLTRGSISTDETFKLIRFHGGHVLCPTPQADPDTCRGLLLASYQILQVHEHKGADWQQTGPDDSSNLYVLNRSSARDAYVLDMFHTRLMTIVQSLLPFSTSTIDPPSFGLLANWVEDPWNKCGAYAGPNSITPGTQELTAIRPLANEQIYMAQIDWMATFGGFAEAGLIMAERIAHRYFNLPRPSWLPQAWYDYVIHTANH